MSTVKGKRFTLKGVLDGLRSSVSTPPKAEMEIEESLRSEHFQVCKVGLILLKSIEYFQFRGRAFENNLKYGMSRCCFILQTVRHGFPFQPTAVAFDPVQHILAIGTKSGSLRMYPLNNCLLSMYFRPIHVSVSFIYMSVTRCVKIWVHSHTRLPRSPQNLRCFDIFRG